MGGWTGSGGYVDIAGCYCTARPRAGAISPTFTLFTQSGQAKGGSLSGFAHLQSSKAVQSIQRVIPHRDCISSRVSSHDCLSSNLCLSASSGALGSPWAYRLRLSVSSLYSALSLNLERFSQAPWLSPLGSQAPAPSLHSPLSLDLRDFLKPPLLRPSYLGSQGPAPSLQSPFSSLPTHTTGLTASGSQCPFSILQSQIWHASSRAASMAASARCSGRRAGASRDRPLV